MGSTSLRVDSYPSEGCQCDPIGMERLSYPDDASTDATEETAYDLICRYSQVRVVRHGRRLGTSEAIQTGLQLSEGEAVFVHKEHEPLKPHDLQRYLEAREQPPAVYAPVDDDPRAVA